ncbi:N-formylglutamate amidohydrolase [Erythrobacter arachoides]|uniref:N-formylglutamate amidohydrolase n=1 Tax=Aurantiacibacter arachoides TaxID=1850444 RepID=A0A844ZXI4_9SPHN|nr:N-formylglutamate amidohydrolase [Aurantiacibacter arachoides]MXO92823.1 N-formylglutamate amidohydrolase [Aurantiacibacter arachoides]GGD54216.1 N-formylglutamate amidohydrolase [Aurantiacibacter arachoides]
MDQIETTRGDSAHTAPGTIPGTTAIPAFSLQRHQSLALPVLIAVPHAGRHYPDALAGRLRHPREASLRLEDRFIDLVAKAVSRTTGAALLVAHAPRAMIDLNRSPDDVDWDMVVGGKPNQRARMAAGCRSRSGLGLVPRRLPGLGELWSTQLTAAELAERVAQVHEPYHATLAITLEALRDKWGAALLLDLHSMPPLGPKTGADPAADYVIGDRFGASCEGRVTMAALDWLAANGVRAAHNRPYAGGYGLDRHGNPARGIGALQLEVCRSLYLDLAMREPGVGLGGTVALVTGLVRRLAGEIAGGSAHWKQAAE